MSDSSEPTEAPNDSANSGRDPKTGRVLPGNKLALGNGGNAGWLRQVRDAFQAVMTPEAMADVWRVIYRQALEGEPAAYALCARYGGAPPQPEQTAEFDRAAAAEEHMRELRERWLVPEHIQERAEEIARDRIEDLERRNKELYELWLKERERPFTPRQEVAPALPPPAPRPPARRRPPREAEVEVREPEPPALPAHEPRTLEDVLDDPRWTPL